MVESSSKKEYLQRQSDGDWLEGQGGTHGDGRGWIGGREKGEGVWLVVCGGRTIVTVETVVVGQYSVE